MCHSKIGNVPVTGREPQSVVRHRGSHIFSTVVSQIVVRLSALRTGRALLPRKKYLFVFWYSFLLKAEKTPGPSVAGRIS
jgi:hypothetical protein